MTAINPLAEAETLNAPARREAGRIQRQARAALVAMAAQDYRAALVAQAEAVDCAEWMAQADPFCAEALATRF